MTQSSSQFQPLLPKLKTNAIAGGTATGRWNTSPGVALFGNIADEIDYDLPPDEQVNSVPNPWARAIQLQSAILDSRYPTRKSLLTQYKGLLAALALCQVKNIPIEARELDLRTQSTTHPFAKALWNLRPPKETSLLPALVNEPWQSIYLFSIQGRVIGFSSPATLVVPASVMPGQLLNSIPWLEAGAAHQDGQGYRFAEPAEKLAPTEKALLAGWFEMLKQAVLNTQGRDSALVGAVVQVLLSFVQELGGTGGGVVNVISNAQPFGIPMNQMPYAALAQPVQSMPQPSNVEVLLRHKSGKRLYFVDKDLVPRTLGLPEHQIFVHDAVTLSSFRHPNAPTQRGLFLDRASMFSPELFYFKLPQAFPGSWLNTHLQDQSYSILLPLNPELRHYFSSDDLKRMTRIEPCQTPEGPGVRVSLKLELSGVDRAMSCPIYQDFPLKAENELKGELPTLALWPNVPPGGWTEYFLLAEESDREEFGFVVNGPSDTATPTPLKDGVTYQFRIWRCDRYPEILEMMDRNGRILGLLPLNVPIVEPGAAQTWNVGVDFGTSFTNVYLRQAERPQRLELKTSLFQITNTGGSGILRYREYFVPDQLLPVKDNPPLSTMITIKGWGEIANHIPSLLTEARIYVPILAEVKSGDHIKSNIKWDNPKYQQPFLAELTRMIAAQGAQQGVQEIRWHVSFPSAFSRADLSWYKGTWERILEELNQISGQSHRHAEDEDAFKTESIAFAQFFADLKGRDLVHTTCIDIGGGTSDISIWEGMELKHQASVPFAGRDIFHSLLQSNLQHLGTLFCLSDKDTKDLREKLENSPNFNSTLDIYLRGETENILRRLNSESSGRKRIEQFRTLLTFGFAGLYHYVGLLLKYLAEEGQMDRKQATPVLLGGNGSRFMHWLALGGRYRSDSEANLMLARVLAKAGGFEPRDYDTVLSDQPKQEAAAGLVVSTTQLKGLNNPDDIIFNGLPCKINNQEFSAHDRLEVPDNVERIERFEIHDFSTYLEFVDNFNRILASERISSIQPLRDFRRDRNFVFDETWKDKLDREVITCCNARGKKGTREDFQAEPPFLMVHKAFLKVLAKEWATKN
ncbi:hypothetical protein GS597_07610 [Synechococcales cyanobacterium C]|uniref:Uncharacterized protein n=1 Tax=Petrachloros mirabilis ULC683 TaxID=2781853 RepID=A0A8K1ZWV8_9CYAN|nr:hypothetical protein [Petrachloros mirabilis]NCJ06378.1 hypothetical protein [Petrachloros mirabilis ULC683]